MNFSTKIFTATALFTSLNANALMKDFVSETTIPIHQLSSYKINDSTPTHEQYIYALSLSQEGFLNADGDMWKKGQESLKKLANKKNYAPAMVALAYHQRYKIEKSCGGSRKCLATPNEDVLYWYERADKLDSTGEVAFELASYWFSMGDVGEKKSYEWSEIGSKKSNAKR